MTTGPGDNLVPGDHDERETRAAYRRAMCAAMPLVRELANGAGATAAPFRAAARVGTRLVDWSPSRVPADVEQGLRAGWLVAGVEPPRRGRRGPGRLDGLTVAVKDIIDVAGMPTRNGTPGGRWRQPRVSAAAWQRLADAGAICIGKAATHEMAWGVTTPQIGNPHDQARFAGGSSGGSAACVAAGVAHGALGTDTGGSIRIPAALCGVVGLRPTHGSIPLAGITPMAPTQDTVGPLAGDVATCTAMLEVLLGRSLQPTDGPAGLRIGVLAEPGRLDTATAVAYAETVRRLEADGAVVVPCRTLLPRWSGAVSLLTMLAESAAEHAEAVRADPRSFGGEARALLTLGDELGDDARLLPAARHALRSRTAQLFTEERLDAFLTPTTACVAPPRDAATVPLGDRDVPVATALTQFTGWASTTGLPAISVPVPTPGLPVGMQLMAPPGAEATCVRLGRALERHAADGRRD